MNTLQRGILTLVRSALTGEKLALPDGFALEEADELIQSQSLLPIAYQGAHNCGIPENSPLMQEYWMRYYLHLVHSEKQLGAVEKIFAAFEENGIDYLPLKGSVIKRLYPKQEFRPMGDADILIKDEQYAVCKEVMTSLGFDNRSESDYDYHWRNADLMAELHKRLFSRQNPELLRYYGDGWHKAKLVQGHRYAMDPEDEYIYIFSHMTKHFRTYGIGARHMIDLYVYRKAHPTMDEARIESVLESLYLLDFYRNVRTMLEVWFEDRPTDPVTDAITDFVFASGNFGHMTNMFYADEVMKANKNKNGRMSKAKTVLRLIFAPLWILQLSYNVLYRAPYLFPIFWVVRWFDILLHRRKNIGAKLGIVQDMSNDKVEEYARMMQFMGIDLRHRAE